MSKEEFTTSVLSDRKRSNILDNYPGLVGELKRHRNEHKALVTKRTVNLRDPAWVRINPGPSIDNNFNSYRLCIGFQNSGCKYRESDPLGLGCLMCGYYARTAFKDVGQKDIFEQFKTGLKNGCNEAIRFNSIEFLNDGSFLNPGEFDQETVERLVSIVNQMPHVKRILIESRPEYITESAITYILDRLRSDQILEIGVGLESADSFIREVCINKGVSGIDFEHAIDVLSELSNKYPKRIVVVTYLLVKPAFLSQFESIEDTIASINYLVVLGEKKKVRIVAKLEPAAIANGTILSMLHLKSNSMYHYEPLNYWGILEILVRSASAIRNKKIEVRVGAREDMDEVLKAPAIYNDDKETFHPIDFVVYESIQKFNQHQDVNRMLAIINEVYRKFSLHSIYSASSEFARWLDKNGIDVKHIAQYAFEHAGEIQKAKNVLSVVDEIALMSSIYGVLDIIEGYRAESSVLKQQINDAVINKDTQCLQLKIEECFLQEAPESIISANVISVELFDSYCEVFFDVKDYLRDNKMSIWSRFVLN